MAAEDGKVDWVRGPKKADLSDVDAEKLNEAAVNRGIEVEVPAGGVGKSKVVKVVVKDMPAPREQKPE